MKNISVILSIVSLFVGVATCAPIDAVFQLQDKNSLMIWAGTSRLALSSQLFSSQNWKTLSVNGESLSAISANCSETNTTFNELNEEQRSLVASAMASFEGEMNDGTGADPKLVAWFTANDLQTQIGPNYEMSTESFSDYIVRRFGPENLSIGRGQLAAKWGLERIFLVDGIVTFVYTDKRVKMSPRNCLKAEDEAVLHSITSDHKEFIQKRTEKELERVKYL